VAGAWNTGRTWKGSRVCAVHPAGPKVEHSPGNRVLFRTPLDAESTTTGKKKFSIIPDFNLIDKVKAARPQIMKKPGSGMASSGFNPLNRFCPGASDQPFQLSVVNTRSNKSGRSRVHPEKIHTCSGYQIKFQNSSSFVLRQRKVIIRFE
jgi:hypothetical protein